MSFIIEQKTILHNVWQHQKKDIFAVCIGLILFIWKFWNHNLPLIGLLYFLSLREHLVPMQPLFWSRAPHGGLPGDGCWTITRVLDWIPLPQLLSQLDHSDQAESWHSTTAKRIAIDELNHLSSWNKELRYSKRPFPNCAQF